MGRGLTNIPGGCGVQKAQMPSVGGGGEITTGREVLLKSFENLFIFNSFIAFFFSVIKRFILSDTESVLKCS